ncbi:MAG: RNA-binding domain-containing protein [Promethearchaeota archaeon]
MIKIELKVEVNPTEEPEKILEVLNNFADIEKENITIDLISENHYLYTTAVEGRKSLHYMFTGLRSQRIVESARKHLMGKMRERTVSFLLNKQALFMKKFHFCHSPEESPMGPVWVKIESDDITRVLEYLVPHTIKGKPQEVHYLPE